MKEKMKIKKEAPAESVVLDSSALLTLWNDEEGADRVAELLGSGKKIYISFMTLMECRYRIWKNIDRNESEKFSAYLDLLPVEIIWVSEVIFEKAVEIKATHNLSVCDSWIIATAIMTSSLLVHKDPEFDQVKDLLPLKPLPYKPKKTFSPLTHKNR
jgi:predicted nucleic acid-binding protein